MYQGGMLAKQEADQRTEEAMMSGKPVQQEESAELNRVKCAMLADQSLHLGLGLVWGLCGHTSTFAPYKVLICKTLCALQIHAM